jgi:hypothetical protein
MRQAVLYRVESFSAGIFKVLPLATASHSDKAGYLFFCAYLWFEVFIEH